MPLDDSIMVSDEVIAHLNRPLGYEVAKLLIHQDYPRHSIKRELPYNVHDEELNRILDLRNEECDINVFERVPTLGGPKWTLNDDLFSDEELESIEDKAIARILDNTSLTEDDLGRSPNNTHADVSNRPSIFY